MVGNPKGLDYRRTLFQTTAAWRHEPVKPRADPWDTLDMLLNLVGIALRRERQQPMSIQRNLGSKKATRAAKNDSQGCLIPSLILGMVVIS